MRARQRLGLYPRKVDDPLVAHRLDMLIAAAYELRSVNYTGWSGFDFTRATYAKSSLPPHLANFARLLGDADYFTPEMTVADIKIYNVIWVSLQQVPTCLDANPNLRAFLARMEARPSIATWQASAKKASLNFEYAAVVNPDGTGVKPAWQPKR